MNAEGLNTLANLDFPNGNDMASRLRWSAELVGRVSGTLKTMQNRYKMHVGKITPGKTPMALGWISALTVPGNQNSGRINLVSGTVRSSVSLGASQANLIGLMGLKR